MSVEIQARAARPEEAADLAALANALDLDQGGPGDAFDAEAVLRDGFAPAPAVRYVIARLDGRPVGYASHCRSYDSDNARPCAWLVDLYVAPEARRYGLGRRLIAAVAAEAAAEGAMSLWLGVYADNHAARAFYGALGAEDHDARILQFDGAAFAALAGGSDAEG